jgi:hypothetical protein
MAGQLKSPFVLLRQALSHGKFEDSETRERMNGVLDTMENELDNNEFEFQSQPAIMAAELLQTHLVELLTLEEEQEEKAEKTTVPKTSVSRGDLDDLDDE